ncbi:MAG: DNA repair protein RecO [Oscillospiraceae bacterium]|nr:DNA repair protein RecO [Oscillospiraceae bacterium]
MNIKTDGIILKELSIGECDRLVTILTKDFGIVRAFVRGARNIKSRQLSSTQLLCYSNLTLYRGRDSYIVDSAEAIELFYDLRCDIQDLSLSLYLAEVLSELSPKDEDACEYLSLILNALHLLAKKKRPALIIKSAVELKVLSLCGYMPDLTSCINCGEMESSVITFSFVEGTFFCDSCSDGRAGEKISPGVAASMRYILYSELKKIFDFNVSDSAQRELSGICEKYLIEQTQRNYKTLDFYHSVEN